MIEATQARLRLAKARPLRAALTVALAVVAIAAIPAAVDAGHGGFAATDDSPDSSTWAGVRIVARGLADGRTEFALQRDGHAYWAPAPRWEDRQFPTRRFVPADTHVGRWLASSPVTLPARGYPDEAIVIRIVARRLSDSRLEFALQQRRTDGLWGERLLPTRRFVPPGARVGRWLASSPLTVAANTYEQPKPARATRFTAVSTGNNHSCGLRTDNTVLCWGLNRHGQADAPDGEFTAVAGRYQHACGLRTDGAATCWGYNDHGQADAPDARFTALAAGDLFTCGLRTDGAVTCWGSNSHGKGATPDNDYTAITAGSSHWCGLRTDGTAACWGHNNFGKADAPGGEFTALAAGYLHSCGLRTDGTITCWGSNARGQLDVPDGQFTAIAAGRDHGCGLRTDRTITCWGISGPRVHGGQFTAIAAGYGSSCGLRTDGTVVCW